MTHSHKDNELSSLPNEHTERSWLISGAIVCVLFGAFLSWSLHALWQMQDTPATSSVKERMMHKKTRTMEDILDGLVRGDLSRVEDAARQMWKLGDRLNWYLSSSLYKDNDEIFRDSTAALIEAAQRSDHDAAKEAALLIERSCIECHALINRESGTRL